MLLLQNLTTRSWELFLCLANKEVTSLHIHQTVPSESEVIEFNFMHWNELPSNRSPTITETYTSLISSNLWFEHKKAHCIHSASSFSIHLAPSFRVWISSGPGSIFLSTKTDKLWLVCRLWNYISRHMYELTLKWRTVNYHVRNIKLGSRLQAALAVERRTNYRFIARLVQAHTKL
jgi:hypothetical protein